MLRRAYVITLEPYLSVDWWSLINLGIHKFTGLLDT